jgi:hypothetical protein
LIHLWPFYDHFCVLLWHLADVRVRLFHSMGYGSRFTNPSLGALIRPACWTRVELNLKTIESIAAILAILAILHICFILLNDEFVSLKLLNRNTRNTCVYIYVWTKLFLQWCCPHFMLSCAHVAALQFLYTLSLRAKQSSIRRQ